MSLNLYTKEVKEFLQNAKIESIDNQQKIAWLGEEFELLKKTVESNEKDKMEHQVYDMLYLLFELAADNDFDLDLQWIMGKKKKQDKYAK